MPGCDMHGGLNYLSVARNPDKPTQNKLKTKTKSLNYTVNYTMINSGLILLDRIPLYKTLSRLINAKFLFK